MTSLVPGVADRLQFCQDLEVCGFLQEARLSAQVISQRRTPLPGCSRPSHTLLVASKPSRVFIKYHNWTGGSYLVICDSVG